MFLSIAEEKKILETTKLLPLGQEEKDREEIPFLLPLNFGVGYFFLSFFLYSLKTVLLGILKN